jgi:hypothetical protein
VGRGAAHAPQRYVKNFRNVLLQMLESQRPTPYQTSTSTTSSEAKDMGGRSSRRSRKRQRSRDAYAYSGPRNTATQQGSCTMSSQRATSWTIA